MAIPGLVPRVQLLINKTIQSETPKGLTQDTVTNATISPSGVQVSASISGAVGIDGTVGTSGSAVGMTVGGAAAVSLSTSALSGIAQLNAGLSFGSPQGNFGGPSSAPFAFALPTGTDSLSFPLDLSTDTGIRMGFTFTKYSREQAQQEPTYTNQAQVYLPVPANLNEQYGVSYSQISPGIAGKAVGELFGNLQSSANMLEKDHSWDGIKGAYNNFADKTASALRGTIAGNTIDNVTDALVLSALKYNILGISDMIKGVTGDIPIEGIIQNQLGKILNPSTTVTLAGVDLRKHNFTWTFAPKSQDESAILKNIFDLFRTSMLPTTTGKFFLDFPMLVQPKFTPMDSNLYPFKQCFITDVKINHAGGGSPSFFWDTKAGTIIEFSISLIETEMFVNNENTPSNAGSTQNPSSQQSDDDDSVLVSPLAPVPGIPVSPGFNSGVNFGNNVIAPAGSPLANQLDNNPGSFSSGGTTFGPKFTQPNNTVSV